MRTITAYLSRRLRPAAVAAGVATFALPAAVHAANWAWDSTPANGNVTGNNWTSGTTPGSGTSAPATGDSLFFGVSSLTTLTNNASAFSFAGLTFNSGASAFIINSNSFTLTGGITNNASGTLETINTPIVFGGNETLTNLGTLSLGGVISGAYNLTATGPGTVNLANTNNSYSGVTIFGPGCIVNVASLGNYGANSSLGNRAASAETSSSTDASASGVGLHFLGGTLQYTGTAAQSCNRQIRMLNGNSATIDASGATPSSTVSFTYSGVNTNLFDTAGTRTMTLTGTNTGNNTFAIVLQDQGSSPTSLQKSGSGTWVVSGVNTFSGPTTISAGTLAIGGSGQLGSGSYAAVITNNGTLVYNSTANQTLSGVISGSGSLTEQGPGTLTLTALNTYAGTTTVSGGELVVPTGVSPNFGTVAVTPASGVATLCFMVTASNTQATCSSLSFNSGGTGTALLIGFDSAPSTTTAPINVTGNLNFNVTPSVTVGLGNLTAGAYPLITVGGSAPSAVPALTLTPAGRVGTLSGSLAWGGSGFSANTLVLTVSGNSAEPLYWNASTAGTWDVNDAANLVWSNTATTYYQESGLSFANDAVVFNDANIAANTTVTVSNTVTPQGVTFNNSTYNYTIAGTGTIAGQGTLTKSGTAALTLSNANTYTGGTVVNAGVVNAAVGGALGGTGSAMVNGTLNLLSGNATYSGLATGLSGNGTVNVGLSTGGNSTILTTVGGNAANYTGFTGTINIGTNALLGTSSATVSASGKALIAASLGAATINIFSNATLYASGAETSSANAVLYGGTTGETYGQMRLDSGVVWKGSITLAGAITGASDGTLGCYTGSSTIAGNIGQTGGNQSLITVGGGTLLLAGTNSYTGPTTNLGPTLKLGSTGALGNGVNNTASLVISSGTVDFNGVSPLAVVPLALNSTANGNDVGSIENSVGAPTAIYGGPVSLGASTVVFGTGGLLFTNTVTGNNKSVNKNGTYAVELTNSGTVNLGGLQINRGSIQVDSGTTLNVTNLNIGTGNSVGSSLVLNGGSISNSGFSVFGAGSGSANGSLTLNAGTLTVTNLAKGAVTFNISFNGGVLKASANNPNFLTNATSASVAAGNAYIDDGGYSIGIAAPLVAGSPSGGLVKQGAGTLTLSGLNTYTAGTTVSNGTLVLANGGGTGCVRNSLTLEPGTLVSLTAGDALGYSGGVCVTNVNIYGGTLTNTGAGLYESYAAYYNLTGGTVGSAGGPFSFTGQGIASLPSSTLSVFNAPIRLTGAGTTLTLSAGAGTVPSGVDLSISGGIYQSALGYGVTKTGTGVVLLNGTNTYSGSTLISAGKLALGATGSVANTTNITIAAGATFDVSAVSGGFTLGSSQTLGGSGTVNGSVTDSSGSVLNPGGSGSVGTLNITTNLALAGGDTLNYNFSAGGSNSVINVGGALTVGGTVTVNLALWPIGGFVQTNYVLLKAASLGGTAANFQLANVPTGGRQTYSIVYNTSTSPKQVLLQVSGFNANLVWAGGGNWDVDISQDWLNGAGLDYFYTSDNVLFSNVAPANATVNITATPDITPGSVVINSTNNYVFTGNAIAGSASLTKNGTGKAILTSAHTYTGGTTINNGTLQLGDGATGDGSVTGNILNNSFLVVSNINPETYNNNINGSGQTVAAGSQSLTLSGTLSGAQQVVGNAGGGLTLSGTNSYTGGTVVSNGILIAATVNALGAPASGVLATVNSGATLAYEVAGTQTLTNTIVGAGSLTYSNGNPGSGGQYLSYGLVGLVVANSNSYSGGTTINVGSIFADNNHALGTGPVTLDNGNGYGSYGYNQLFLGKGVVFSNAITVVNASDYFDGVLMADPGPNNSGGASDTNGATFAGPITVANGANIAHGGLFCGPIQGTNWLVIAGPVTNLTSGGGITMRNGRTRFSGGGSYAVLSVGSGQAQLGANNGLATNAALWISGGSFDFNGYSQTLTGLSNPGAGSVNNSSATASTLTLEMSSDSTYSGVISGNITLVDDSTARLQLSGTNTYTGNTVLTAGTLQLSGNGSLTNTPTISVSSNATLDVASTTSGWTLKAGQTLKGDGPFNVLGNVVSHGKIELKVNKSGSGITSDSVNELSGITYGGTLQLDLSGSALVPGDTVTLFNSGTYAGAFASIVPATPGSGLAWDTSNLAVNGTLAVASGVSLTPTNLTGTVSGSSLNLSWPADHIGWRLLEQTNNLSKGVSANPADWGTVTGSATTNAVSLPIDATVPGAYYQLVYP